MKYMKKKYLIVLLLLPLLLTGCGKKDIETLKLNQGGGSSITIDEIFGGEVTQDDIDNLFSA